MTDVVFILAVIVPFAVVIVAVVLLAFSGAVSAIRSAGMRPAMAGGAPAPVAAGGGVKTVAPKEGAATQFWNWLTETQVWKSVFRHDRPNTDRTRVLVMLSNLFLHLHPVRIRKSGVKLRYTWCMGGLSFFLFLVLTFTGLLLMFYYRPTLEYAYSDIVGLREHVPLGIMREMHRWGAHAMEIGRAHV